MDRHVIKCLTGCLLLVCGLLTPCYAQIVVEDASLVWETGLTPITPPIVPPHIVVEYASKVSTAELLVPDELPPLQPRIIVEYATKIVHFGLAKLPVCECNLNGDSNCNILDYQLFIQDWGRANCGTPPGTGNPPNDCECDLNQDGKCNILDYQIFIQDWGRTDCP